MHREKRRSIRLFVALLKRPVYRSLLNIRNNFVFDMSKTIVRIIFLTLLCVNVWAIEGVKGGQRPRYPISGSQHSNSNNTTDNGLCYRRVP